MFEQQLLTNPHISGIQHGLSWNQVEKYQQGTGPRLFWPFDNTLEKQEQGYRLFPRQDEIIDLHTIRQILAPGFDSNIATWQHL